jgi:hypothetical protein
MPFTETYFAWKVITAIARVLAWFGVAILAGIYLALKAIWPDQGPHIALCLILGLLGTGAFLVLYTLVSMFTSRPPTNEQIQQSLGWVPNPPKGESWFRADGSKKQYDHSTGLWS